MRNCSCAFKSLPAIALKSLKLYPPQLEADMLPASLFDQEHRLLFITARRLLQKVGEILSTK